MIVNDTLILKLEKLARLQLSPDERLGLSSDLQKMLNMVDKLQSLDTTGVEPLVYMNAEINAPAPDAAAANMDRNLALKNAPQHNDVFFQVPKVVDK